MPHAEWGDKLRQCAPDRKSLGKVQQPAKQPPFPSTRKWPLAGTEELRLLGNLIYWKLRVLGNSFGAEVGHAQQLAHDNQGLGGAGVAKCLSALERQIKAFSALRPVLKHSGPVGRSQAQAQALTRLRPARLAA